jgi:hypothetical protein
MSAAKHTPGPWVYERDNGPGRNRPYITTVALCCDFVIGLPSAFAGGNYRDGDPSGDAEADARLIAAAPEMYEALRAMYDMDWRIGPTKGEYTRALIALAKATGEQS